VAGAARPHSAVGAVANCERSRWFQYGSMKRRLEHAEERNNQLDEEGFKRAEVFQNHLKWDAARRERERRTSEQPSTPASETERCNRSTVVRAVCGAFWARSPRSSVPVEMAGRSQGRDGNSAVH
jgi:hypothetical protein